MKIFEYYQPVFAKLSDKYASEVSESVILEAKLKQTDFIAKKLPHRTLVSNNDAWQVFRDSIDKIEAELESNIKGHSAFFWLHLFRRTGCYLNRPTGEQTDSVTVGLVREIVELAIQKYGNLNIKTDVQIANKVEPKRIMGGMFLEVVKELEEATGKDMSEFVKSISQSRSFVVTEFKYSDFINLFRIQALAYEYWRLTATLRALGKGVSIWVDDEGGWQKDAPQKLQELISSFDERNRQNGGALSLLGTWSVQPEETCTKDMLPLAVKNIDQTFNEEFQCKTNFLLGNISIGQYVSANEGVEADIKNHFGCSTHNLLCILQGLSLVSFVPTSTWGAKYQTDAEHMFMSARLQLCQRGYTVFNGALKDLALEVDRRLKWAHASSHLDVEAICKVLLKLTLNPQVQNKIGIWSRGPIFVLHQIDGGYLIDVASISSFLYNFSSAFNLDDPLTRGKGDVFEDEFRKAINEISDQEMHHDVLISGKKVGEIDAAYVVGTTMYVFECYSKRRRWDFEISEPEFFNARYFGKEDHSARDCFKDKLGQVTELCSTLSANKVGDNYDYNHIQHFEPLVISPFVEWIWGKDCNPP